MSLSGVRLLLYPFKIHRRASLIGWKLDLYIMWNSLAQTYRIHKSGAKGVKIDVIFIEYLFFWAGTQKSVIFISTHESLFSWCIIMCQLQMPARVSQCSRNYTTQGSVICNLYIGNTKLYMYTTPLVVSLFPSWK